MAPKCEFALNNVEKFPMYSIFADLVHKKIILFHDFFSQKIYHLTVLVIGNDQFWRSFFCKTYHGWIFDGQLQGFQTLTT